MSRTKENHPNPRSILLFYRYYYGKSQAVLAEELGLTTKDVSRFERGTSNMRVEKVRRIARYLRISVDDLMNNNYTALLPTLPPAPVRDPSIQKRRRQCALRKLDNGDLGEHLVADLERQKLAGTPYANGVNEAFADDPHNGFDIASFTPEGVPKFIEVKTTAGPLEEDFYLTANELSFLESCLKSGLLYELHRVYDLQDEQNAAVKIYSAQEIMDQFSYEIYSYRVWRNIA